MLGGGGCVCGGVGGGGGGCYLYTQREKGRVGGVNFIPRERRRGLMLAFPWILAWLASSLTLYTVMVSTESCRC